MRSIFSNESKFLILILLYHILLKNQTILLHYLYKYYQITYAVAEAGSYIKNNSEICKIIHIYKVDRNENIKYNMKGLFRQYITAPDGM